MIWAVTPLEIRQLWKGELKLTTPTAKKQKGTKQKTEMRFEKSKRISKHKKKQNR